MSLSFVWYSEARQQYYVKDKSIFEIAVMYYLLLIELGLLEQLVKALNKKGDYFKQEGLFSEMCA